MTRLDAASVVALSRFAVVAGSAAGANNPPANSEPEGAASENEPHSPGQVESIEDAPPGAPHNERTLRNAQSDGEINPYGGLCDVYSCHKDCGSCCLVTWAPCTCCITYCIFRQNLGSLISPHGSEVASCCNQIKNCCSYAAPAALRNIPVVGGAVAVASECLNLAICPLQNQYNCKFPPVFTLCAKPSLTLCLAW